MYVRKSLGFFTSFLQDTITGRDDMLKFFQVCIPFATSVMGTAVEKYGFEASQNGIVCFDVAMRLQIFLKCVSRMHDVSGRIGKV